MTVSLLESGKFKGNSACGVRWMCCCTDYAASSPSFERLVMTLCRLFFLEFVVGATRVVAAS